MEIVAIIAVLIVLIGVPVVAVNRDLIFHRSASKRTPVEPPLPFLIIPSYLGAADLVPAGTSRQQPPAWPTRARAQNPTPSDVPRHPLIADETPSDFLTEAMPEAIPEAMPETESAERWLQSFDESADSEELEFEDSGEAEELSPDATVIFNRPVDEPMQILPGRLRVISGEPATEDLRLFSRLGEPPRIVVGRDSGPPHRHITLHSPTVSRRHARMDFDHGVWTITNLSQTNPVLVNDRVLSNGGSARTLSDGDRIELGEVALRFLSS